MQFSYTTDELSRVLGISSARIRQLIGAGKLKARRVGRRVWVIQRTGGRSDAAQEDVLCALTAGPRARICYAKEVTMRDSYRKGVQRMTQKQDSSVGLEEIMEAYEQMRYARERVEQLRDELKEARRELAQAESQLHGLFEQLRQ
ncbi:MAG: hypothetical protein KatS3mg038_1428 [Candidatus Kapaibacterium sp.]|nr:MAG: hypothetical protein KatS3mg038_1428 [Candidatus Kapabacteria bacterium]